MFLENVRAALSVHYRNDPDPENIKGRFRFIREGLDDLVPEGMESLAPCHHNLKALNEKKLQAYKIYRETRPLCPLLAYFAKWLYSDSADLYWTLKDEYKMLNYDIDNLIMKNHDAIEVMSQNILSNPKMTEGPFDLMCAFIYGCRNFHTLNIYKKQLRDLFFRVKDHVIRGDYPLEAVRTIARESKKIFPVNELMVDVVNGGQVFEFHYLLFFSQFKVLKRKDNLSFPFEEIRLAISPKILQVIYEIIEKGWRPRFKGFDEDEVLAFLETCILLGLSVDVYKHGIYCLEDKSKTIYLKLIKNGCRIVVKGDLGEKGLRKLEAIDRATPVIALDLCHTKIAPTSDVLKDILGCFPHLQRLRLAPYSTASTEDWTELFNHPDLKKIGLDFKEGYIREYLENLQKAIEDHPRPPEITLIKGMTIPPHEASRFLFKNPPKRI